MCCRLQQYPLPLLVSLIIGGPRCLWRGLVPLIGLALNRLPYPVLMGHSVHIGRNKPTDTHLHPFRIMSIVVTNLQDQLTALQESMKTLQDSITGIETQLKQETEASDFDVFVQNEIAPIFGESTSENIIKVLLECRRNGNFFKFIPVYQWKTIHGDLKKRNTLKVVSAAYRIRYAKSQTVSPQVYSLKSEVKYAIGCHECGSTAKNLHARLVKEGYMTV